MDINTYKFIAEKTNDTILEEKKCKQCSKIFAITKHERKLLEKISPVIGWKKQLFEDPECCPDCRARQRLIRRNEWNFYNSKSSFSGKKIFSLLPPNSDTKVVSLEEFWTDEFNSSIPHQDINMWSSILEQIWSLRDKIPTQSTMTIDNQNCHYTTWTWYCKNCYLINSSENSEDCMYGKLFQSCKKCIDCSYVYDSEKLYQCINVKNGYNNMRLNNSQDCSFCYFSDDLISCQNCMFCSWLRNSQYYFENKQYSKDEWNDKIKNYLWSEENIESWLKLFEEIKKNKIYKFANIINSENSYWDFQTDNQNCVYCYDTNWSQDCRYVSVGVEIKSVMDWNNIYLNPEKCYNNVGIMHVHDIHSCVYVFDSHSLIFCQECHNSNNLFGCVWLKNKQYCIFNKQYTKEEYEKLVPQIIKKMKSENERNFFDPKYSHYTYNDSLAMEYFPIKEVKKDGITKIINPKWEWTVIILDNNEEISNAILDLWWEYKMPIKWKNKEKEINIPDWINIISSEDNKNLDTNTILNSAFLCKKSWRLFRILKQELEFYQNMWLPIPSVHPDTRYKNRLEQKPRRNLYKSNCKRCNTDIVTVYENKKYNVLCQECYDKEIY